MIAVRSVWWVSLLVSSAGCRQLLGFEGVVLDGVDDASGDGSPLTDGAPPDDPPGQFCVGTFPIRPCFASEPTDTISLAVGFNTDTSCPAPMVLDGRPVCVLAGGAVTISNTAQFAGSQPLVIVGVTSITVNFNATLDLSSSKQVGVRIGAGAQPQACQGSTSPSNTQDGAAGGSFASKGGNGGKGSGGRMGGVAETAQQIEFRGGCEGADGPLNNFGGPGGGAVYLISDIATIDGKIRATGGGGEGIVGGGGGGGSGGYIGIDAATVILGSTALLVATGGGGAGGGCMGSPGGTGRDADTGSNIVAAGGLGADADPSGDGGIGGSINNVNANAGVESLGASCAGGGGGGGVGTIQFFQGRTCPASRCFPSAVSNP